MLVITTWTGRTAAALRLSMRMTCDDFAAHLGVSSRGVAKWEAHPAGELAMRTQQLLDVALARADDEARARFSQLLADPTTEPAQSASPSALAAPPRLTARLPQRVTPELLATLRDGLRHQYTADNLLGPRALLPAVIAHADTVEHLAREATGPTMDQLLRIGAGYAEFAGWLYQDSGDAEAATTWYRRALEWAEVGQDPRMAAFVLTRRAVQAIASRNGAHGARLAHAAQRDHDPMTARVRALAAQTEAVGYAVLGAEADADRALDRAERLLDAGGDAQPADGDPSEGRYCDLRLYLSISRAKCHLELGRADHAVAAFTTVLKTLPADYHRDRGQYLARLAHAYMLAGSPDEACTRAEESLAIALATGSSRTLDDLRNLTGHLRPWATHPGVIRLNELIVATAA